MKSAICIVAAGVLWGVIPLFVSALECAGFTSLQVVAIRVLLAAAILVAALLVRDRSQLRIRLRDLPLFVGTGLLTGKDGGRLDPGGSASRAQTAAILMRFCQGADASGK